MHAFLKVETAEAMAASGCIAAAPGGDAIHLVEWHAGEEPDEGVELELWAVPGDQGAMF